MRHRGRTRGILTFGSRDGQYPLQSVGQQPTCVHLPVPGVLQSTRRVDLGLATVSM